jgi:hypothetical protein
MRDGIRLFATLIIWTVFAGIVIPVAAFTMNRTTELNTIGAVMLFLFLFALMEMVGRSTQAIWGSAESDHRRPPDHLPVRKAKRDSHNRVERLLADLDDDEVYDLQSRLLGRDVDVARHGEWR